MKKLLSVVLALAMVMSLATMFPVSAVENGTEGLEGLQDACGLYAHDDIEDDEVVDEMIDWPVADAPSAQIGGNVSNAWGGNIVYYVTSSGTKLPSFPSSGYISYWQYWGSNASIYSAMSKWGCRVIAQSKLLAETKVISGITPDDYLVWGRNQGYFAQEPNITEYYKGGQTGQCMIAYAATNGVTITRSYISLSGSNSSDDCSKIMNLLNSGYYVILDSSSAPHQAYVGRTVSMDVGQPVICDNGQYGDACHTFMGSKIKYQTAWYYTVSGTPAPPSISAKVERVDSNVLGKYSVGETNAILTGKVTVTGGNSTLITETGVALYDTLGTRLAIIHESGKFSGKYNYVDILYDINKELNYTLKSNTTYKYKFFATVNGKYYESPEYSFTTLHTHSYSGDWKSDATNHWKECSCGEKGNIAAHSWNSGTVTKQPTCTDTGIKTYTCTVCQRTKTEPIPAKGHTPGAAATCTTSQKCTVCGTQLAAALGHDYKGTYYDEAHPHAEYQLCTRCNDRKDTGKYGKDNNCPICNPSNPDPQPTDAQIVLGNSSGKPGSTVVVPISLKNNPGIVSMMLKIEYNSSILKLVKVEDSGKLGTTNHNPSKNILSWENDTAASNYTTNGEIAKLYFTISPNAPDGKTEVTVTYDKSGGILDFDMNMIAFGVSAGAVNVTNVICGDVNGDGIVNAVDRVTLSRHLAGWEGYENIDEAAADVNGDGKVNAQDRVILSRHLAKWEGYETLPYKK